MLREYTRSPKCVALRSAMWAHVPELPGDAPDQEPEIPPISPPDEGVELPPVDDPLPVRDPKEPVRLMPRHHRSARLSC